MSVAALTVSKVLPVVPAQVALMVDVPGEIAWHSPLPKLPGELSTDATVVAELSHDARFVTARHCLQSLWKVGTVGYRQRERLLSALRDRFAAAASEENGTLVRYDITVVLRRVYDAVGDEDVKAASEAWIDQETDPKYRKKYEKVWRSSAPV